MSQNKVTITIQATPTQIEKASFLLKQAFNMAMNSNTFLLSYKVTAEELKEAEAFRHLFVNAYLKQVKPDDYQNEIPKP